MGNRWPNSVSDQVFIDTWKRLQSGTLVAKELGLSVRAAMSRRATLEARYDIRLSVFDERVAKVSDNRAVISLQIDTGTVLVGSDAHIWPGERTTAQRAFIKFCKELKPTHIVMNGDVFDGAAISRFPSIGWESKPDVKQELEAVGQFLEEIHAANPKARKIWAAGNHDLRLESRIAAVAPEFKGVKGVHLKDFFPDWLPCWRIDVNDDVVIRHREYGGEHADWNNVMKSGKTIVTGHDHRIGVVPYTDYRGTRYGVRTGFLADSPQDPQFVNYLEARAPNWGSGFAVLTFHKRKLLFPEVVTKWDEDHVQFRGGLVKV